MRKKNRFSYTVYTINQLIDRTECIRIVTEFEPSKSGVIPPVELVDIDIIGYGKIPKLVTTDPQLGIKAKAVFGLLASGNNWQSSEFYSCQSMCRILKISKSTFYKAINELLEHGCIVEFRQPLKRGYKPIYYVNISRESTTHHLTSNGV